jgi:hypothetical protein
MVLVVLGLSLEALTPATLTITELHLYHSMAFTTLQY